MIIHLFYVTFFVAIILCAVRNQYNLNQYTINPPAFLALIELIASAMVSIIPITLAIFYFFGEGPSQLNHQIAFNIQLYMSAIYLTIRWINTWVIRGLKKRHNDYVNSLPVQLPLPIK